METTRMGLPRELSFGSCFTSAPPLTMQSTPNKPSVDMTPCHTGIREHSSSASIRFIHDYLASPSPLCNVPFSKPRRAASLTWEHLMPSVDTTFAIVLHESQICIHVLGVTAMPGSLAILLISTGASLGCWCAGYYVFHNSWLSHSSI